MLPFLSCFVSAHPSVLTATFIHFIPCNSMHLEPDAPRLSPQPPPSRARAFRISDHLSLLSNAPSHCALCSLRHSTSYFRLMMSTWSPSRTAFNNSSLAPCSSQDPLCLSLLHPRRCCCLLPRHLFCHPPLCDILVVSPDSSWVLTPTPTPALPHHVSTFQRRWQPSCSCSH